MTINIKRALAGFSVSSLLLTSAAWADTVIYSTGFDTAQGYVAGDINGQNGWSTYEPGAGGGYANVTLSAPAGFSGTGALNLNTGIDANTSPRYAWPTGYGTTFASLVGAGAYGLYTENLMYLASGQTSAARMGLANFDSTGAKILSGYLVQANTGAVYLLGYYNNAGTLNNYLFSTGQTIGFDQWVNFTTTWDTTTGRFTLGWGSNSFYVDGAGAGSNAEETDFYGTRNSSTVASGAYFDNLEVGTLSVVPEPATAALAGLGLGAMLVARRRRA